MTTAVSRRLESFDSDTQVAVRAVRDAIRLARSLEGRAQAAIKSDTSPVTVADLAIQALVAARLVDAFPDDPLVAEEDAALLRADPDLSRQVVEVVRQIIRDATFERVVAWIGDGDSESGSRLWTLDPIDGSKGFLHGRQYGHRARVICGRQRPDERHWVSAPVASSSGWRREDRRTIHARRPTISDARRLGHPAPTVVPGRC